MKTKPWYTSPLAVSVFAGGLILALVAAFRPTTSTTATTSTTSDCGCGG